MARIKFYTCFPGSYMGMMELISCKSLSEFNVACRWSELEEPYDFALTHLPTGKVWRFQYTEHFQHTVLRIAHDLGFTSATGVKLTPDFPKNKCRIEIEYKETK